LPDRRRGAPGLVAAAECKLRGEPVDPAAIAAAAEGLRRQPGGKAIDTVVLACTHFPLLEEELGAAFGPEVAFVHGADGIARRIAYLTAGQPFQRAVPDLALVTGTPEDCAALNPALARHGLEWCEPFY
jgi:glutamate racemase